LKTLRMRRAGRGEIGLKACNLLAVSVARGGC
jgi:hypothetical protein